MGQFSIAHILVVAVVVMVLFGRGKVSSLLGEVGRGISSFKLGLRDGSEETPPSNATAPESVEKSS